MRIAVDAMGGDNAPREIVLGALQAVSEYKCEVVLVGDEKVVQRILDKESPDWRTKGISLRHASENIEMHEHPGAAVRRKKDASIVVATALVKDGS